MSKKKKTILIVSIIVAVLAGLGVGAYFVVPEMMPWAKYTKMADEEFLTEIGSWQKQDSPSLVWTFGSGNKGSLTTNGGLNTYDMVWEISGDKLTIKTDWFYTMEDEFTFTIDKKEKILTVVSSEDDKETVFVPAEKSEASTEESSETDTENAAEVETSAE